MMRVERRGFIVGTLSLLAAPLAAEAQTPGKVYRIAYLGSMPPLSPPARVSWDAFLRGLRERSWIEGQNIVIERRYAQGRPERFPEFVAEVLRIQVDVIVVGDSQAAWAAKRATNTTPIILNVADAVGQGLVASLARPGGNITGLSNQIEEVIGKLIETLKESVPSLARLAVVHNPNNPASRNLRNEEAAASRLGIKVVPVVFRTPDDLAPAFATIARERADALFPHIASPIGEHWPQFIEFAQKQRLPTGAIFPRFVELGGLFYYGPDFADLWYRTAHYVDRVLRGTKPADLPIEQPTKFQFGINLKTAKALGLTIPPAVLARADEVIE